MIVQRTPKRGQELRQLDRDDAAADEGGALRELVDVRHVAVGPVSGLLQTWNRRDDRVGAGGDDDRLGLELSAARLDPSRPGDRPRGLDHGHAAALVV
jgi:hypothetical protein